MSEDESSADLLRQLIATLRGREPLRNDQWVKGYHAALHDLEMIAGLR